MQYRTTVHEITRREGEFEAPGPEWTLLQATPMPGGNALLVIWQRTADFEKLSADHHFLKSAVRHAKAGVQAAEQHLEQATKLVSKTELANVPAEDLARAAKFLDHLDGLLGAVRISLRDAKSAFEPTEPQGLLLALGRQESTE